MPNNESIYIGGGGNVLQKQSGAYKTTFATGLSEIRQHKSKPYARL